MKEKRIDCYTESYNQKVNDYDNISISDKIEKGKNGEEVLFAEVEYNVEEKCKKCRSLGSFFGRGNSKKCVLRKEATPEINISTQEEWDSIIRNILDSARYIDSEEYAWLKTVSEDALKDKIASNVRWRIAVATYVPDHER